MTEKQGLSCSSNSTLKNCSTPVAPEETCKARLDLKKNQACFCRQFSLELDTDAMLSCLAMRASWFFNGFWQGQMQAFHVQKDQIEHDITHLSFCLPKASLKKIGIYCNQHVKISGIKYKKYIFQYGGYYRVISKRNF